MKHNTGVLFLRVFFSIIMWIILSLGLIGATLMGLLIYAPGGSGDGGGYGAIAMMVCLVVALIASVALYLMNLKFFWYSEIVIVLSPVFVFLNDAMTPLFLLAGITAMIEFFALWRAYRHIKGVKFPATIPTSAPPPPSLT